MGEAPPAHGHSSGAALRPAGCLTVSGAAFGAALFSNWGYQSGAGFALVALGVASALAGLALLHRERWPPVPTTGALVAWLAVAVALAASDEPWSYFLPTAARDARPAAARWLMLVGLGLVAAAALRGRDVRWLSAVRCTAFAAALVLGAWWTIERTPDPDIDVWHMHTDAVQRLLRLENPYEPSFEYRGRVVDFYGYPPITLLVQVPFHVLLGDVRYASVAGLLAAGWAARFLALQARLPLAAADAAGAILLVQGRPFYQVEQAWTEPLVLGLVALAAVAWARRSRATALLGGLAFAAKQFLWPFALLVGLVRGPTRRELAWAAAALALLVLPFVAWGPEAFWRGVVLTHVDGSAVHIAYPQIPEGEAWPTSVTLAVYLKQYGHDWPLVAGPLAWAAVGATFLLVRGGRRSFGLLSVTAAASVAVLGFLGAAFHPNYVWLLPGLMLVGLLADAARVPHDQRLAESARVAGAEPADGREAAGGAGEAPSPVTSARKA